MKVPATSSFRFTHHAVYRYAQRAGLTLGEARAELHRLKATATIAGVSHNALRFRCRNGCTLAVKEDGAVVSAYWRGEKYGNRVLHRPTLDGRVRKIVVGRARSKRG